MMRVGPVVIYNLLAYKDLLRLLNGLFLKLNIEHRLIVLSLILEV